MYATNSEYYENPIYFGSDQYSDDVINYFLYTAWDKSFSRNVYRQQEFDKQMRRSIDVADFTRDVRLNTRLKLPVRAFVLKLDGFRLPIGNKKRFINQYGNFNKPIAMRSIMLDGKTFTHSIFCTLDKYAYLDLYFLPTTYGYTYLVYLPVFTPTDRVVKDDNEIYETFETTTPTPAGVWTDTQFKQFQENHSKLVIQWTRHGDIYRAGGTLRNYVNTTDGTITLPRVKSQVANFVENDYDSNSWDILITDGSGIHSKCYMRCVGVLDSIDNDKVVFKVPSPSFVATATRNAVGMIYAIKRPTRVSCIYYEHIDNLVPIFQIDTISSPISQYSYLISELQWVDKRCLNTDILDIEPRFYPNVIDLTNTPWYADGKNLIIEIFERPIKDATCKFDNPIQNYMNAVGKYYPSIVTDAMQCPPVIADYTSTLPPTAEDYPYDTSPYWGNIRGYYLNILNDVCNDDPMRLKDLQKYLNAKNKKFTTKSGTPADLKFTSEYVMDNSKYAVVQKDDTTHFTEPHGMFRYTTDAQDSGALVYMNGILQKIELNYYCAGFEYLYLPKSKIDMGMARYTTTEEMDLAKPITIDAFPRYTTLYHPNIYQSLMYDDTTERKPLFEDVVSKKGFSIDDLIFYDNNTMEYIDKSKFHYGVLTDQYIVKHERRDEVVMLDKARSVEYLLTSLGEVYRTMDVQEIILKEADFEIDMSNLVAKDPAGLSVISSKEHTPGTLTVGIKDPSMVGTEIIAQVSTRLENREFSGLDIIQNNNLILWKHFNMSNDPRKAEVYHNGVLLRPSEYRLVYPSKLGGTLIVDLNPIRNFISPNSRINVVILPVAFDTYEYVLKDNMVRSYNFVTHQYNPVMNIFNFNPSGIEMYELAPKPNGKFSELIDFETSRVFINGQRLAYKDNDDLKLINQFYISHMINYRVSQMDYPLETWSNAVLTVKSPARGTDIYKMNKYMMQNMQQSLINL